MCNTKKGKEIGGEGGIRTPVQAVNPQLDFELVNAIIPLIPACQVTASFYSHLQESQHFNQLQTDCVGSRMIGTDGNELVSNLNTEPGAIGFCEHCLIPIYDSAISNHILFRCEKYNQGDSCGITPRRPLRSGRINSERAGRFLK
jgi:hypothetical protein